MKKLSHTIEQQPRRRGSTLVIVLALLGLLAFTGMVFYTFAAQERASAEYFAEAAKAVYSEPSDVWDPMLRQVLVGPSEAKKGSILYSQSRRHSMVRNLVGSDVYPATGRSVELNRTTPIPTVINNPPGDDLLDFVDSPAARNGVAQRNVPEPDVDYTYPDINNLFLAYRGWAIQENWEIDQNGSGGAPDPEEDRNGNGTWDQTGPQYSLVPVIIPSFFRPAYMKQTVNNKDARGSSFNVATDPYWAYADDGSGNPVQPTNALRDVPFDQRSFRPNPQHIAGVRDDRSVVLRYLTDDEATSLGVAAGGFPFLPENISLAGVSSDPNIQGELGIFTGSHPLAYELDADNDGDGIKEGIWLDLRMPVQQFNDGGNIRNYVVLHSVTIYDMDGLFNLNAHGNLRGLPTGSDSSGNPYTLPTATTDGFLTNGFLSRSNLGLGPNEINPLWGLRRFNNVGPPVLPDSDELWHFSRHFGRDPANEVEQANMEWAYLKLGRGEYDTASGDFEQLHTGVYGDANLLFASLERRPTSLVVSELPRPGRAGNPYQNVSTGVSFGGRGGFDDNGDRLEGEPQQSRGRIRPYGHPMDFAGVGRHYRADYPVFDDATGRFGFDPATGNAYSGANSDDPRLPMMLNDGSFGPERWRAYRSYSATSGLMTATPLRYSYGPNQTYDGRNSFFPGSTTGDDLNQNPFFNALFEDPLEVIFDHTHAARPQDDIFSIGDLLALHMVNTDIGNSSDDISTRITDLANFVFDTNQSWNGANVDHREMFTTLSNALRMIPMAENASRPWEFSADTDGPEDNSGFGRGDSKLEFPPAFGNTVANGKPFSKTDPFRPQVRRLLTIERGEGKDLVGALPISVNHVLDVERTDQTPVEGTGEFLRYMRRTGLRLRPLTEHPDVSEDTTAVPALTSTDIPVFDQTSTALPAYPPTTYGQREFWARRDRQMLARDIYVLLYTIGGADVAAGSVRDYSSNNDVNAVLPATPLYTHEQLRRMAQFAVNLVDAMDTDNVMTKFEYDKNLGDGWNLDDNPYTSSDDTATATTAEATGNGMYPLDSDARGVVFGVETQQLAFSEVLAVRSPEISAGDHEATPFDDTTGDRDFLFVELQNMLPQILDLATSQSNTADTAIWRLARFDRAGANTDPVELPTAPEAAIAILEQAENEIDGGGRFSISVSSDTGLTSSSLFIDLGDPATANFDGTYELVAPDAPSVLDTTSPGYDQPLTDIDVVSSTHMGRFAEVSGNLLDTLPTTPYAGNDSFDDQGVVNDNFTSDSRLGFDLVLQRRLNPNLPNLTEAENHWVEVDRIRVTLTNLDIDATSTPGDVFDPANVPASALGKIKAFERSEPLNDSTRAEVATPKTTTAHRFNSLKGERPGVIVDSLGVNTSNLSNPSQHASTTNPALAFNVWQPHFDRPFTSTGELLNLPVYGPSLTTHRISRTLQAPFQQVDGSSATPEYDRISNAAAMILQPDFPDDTSGTPPVPTDPSRDNRWYRLLNFVEVPSRVHQMLGNYLAQNRVPGKLNLNTVRHLEVYAGLIDDPMFADLDRDRNNSPFLNEQTPGSLSRDRWHELINERDGEPLISFSDPTPNDATNADGGYTRFWLPGTQRAKPFRSLSNAERADNGLEETVLRRLEADVTDTGSITIGGKTATQQETNRHWLEVGHQGDHHSPDASSTVVQRHQLLSKIVNNTTTVSNSFVMFSTAAYFEAVEDPSGFWRVGGRIDLDNSTPDANPGWQQRAVFVLDRSDVYEAFDGGTGSFDWQRLVKHRATIE